MHRKIIVTTLLLLSTAVLADTVNLFSNNRLRIRTGDNAFGSINTVEFNIAGDAVGNGAAVASGNAIPGASGPYTVRVVVDSLSFNFGPYEVRADSSAGLQCATPALCGSENIPFSSISWSNRDGDAFADSNQFDGSSNQRVHRHIHNGIFSPERRRDYLRFEYDNAQFYPAGTYEGIVTFTATK